MRRLARSPRLLDVAYASLPSPVASSSLCIFCQHRAPSAQHQRSLSTSQHHLAESGSLFDRARRSIFGGSKKENVDARAEASKRYEDYRRRGRRSGRTPSLTIGEDDIGRPEDDAKVYAQQLRQQERDALQQQVNEAPEHRDYAPAEDWDGLEMVGGEKEWDSGRRFEGFLPEIKLEEPEEITIAIYRSVVEVFAAVGAGRTPLIGRKYINAPLINQTTSVRIEITKAGDPEGAGNVRLIYPSAAVEKAILAAGSESAVHPSAAGDDFMQDVTAPEAEQTSDEAEVRLTDAAGVPVGMLEKMRALTRSWGGAWHQIPLTDPRIKLALVKRITRLTGHQIPDPLIHRATSVTMLVVELTRPKPAATVFEALEAGGGLAEVGNVSVFGRRETPIDRQKKVGRWKLIERELVRRELPVTGR